MAVVIDVALLSDEERTQEPREISRPEREIQEDVEGEDNNGPCGNQSTRGKDPQAERVPPADPRNIIPDLCPHSPQDPQALGPLAEEVQPTLMLLLCYNYT